MFHECHQAPILQWVAAVPSPTHPAPGQLLELERTGGSRGSHPWCHLVGGYNTNNSDYPLVNKHSELERSTHFLWENSL